MKKMILPSIIAFSLHADNQESCDSFMHKTHTQLAKYKKSNHTMSKSDVDAIKLTIKMTTQSCNGLVPETTIVSLNNVYMSMK